MMLTEYLKARGALPAASPAGSMFSAIRAFLFGEEYTVELILDGDVSSYRFDDLDDALAVMADEFKVDDRFVPNIEIVAYAKTRNPRFGLDSISPVQGEKSGFTPGGTDTGTAAAVFSATPQVPTFGPAATRVLAVTRAERNMAFEAPPLEFYAEQVKEAVTFYSLSGTWDMLDGRSNL